MERHGNHDIIERIQNDQEFVAEFTSNMQLITKQTGIELTIDTSREGVAWMKPGSTKVFFNPIYTLKLIQSIQQKRAKEFGISENFTFNINHLSQLVLHEINHMINHAQLKMSDKKIKIGKKKLNMVEYEEFLHMKYGQEFHEFENMLEDIDVNNHATMIQAPVFDSAKQDIYHHITIPSKDFSQDPLADQFGWAILRESMLPGEQCIVDPLVRDCIDYLSEPGEALEKLRDPNLKYDEQLPIIHRLFENYYLKFKKEDEKNGKTSNKNNKQAGPNGSSGAESENFNPSHSSQNSQNKNQAQGAENTSSENENSNHEDNKNDSENNPNGNKQDGKKTQGGQSSNGESPENENGNNENENSSKESGILGKLKDRLSNDLGSKKKGEKTNENDSDKLDNKENQNNNNDEKQDSSPQAPQNDDTSNQKENEQKRQPYRPGKPMLLPHIFEDLDGEGNNLLEQIEQSLDNKGKPNNEKSDNEESESNKSKKQNSPSSQDVCNTIQQAIEQTLQQQQEDANKSPEERNLEAIIQQERNIDKNDKSKMRDIKNAIKTQNQLKEKIKNIKDEKGQSVYDKITKDIFSKIVQLRKRNKISERHARPFSEGGQLDPQNLVSGIMDWKAGDDDPRILQQEYREQKEKMKAGGFSITFILDGSGSMSGEKNRQQALSTLLMLYSLQQLNQDIKLEGGDMEDFLISTQAMMFCGKGKVALLKDRGKDLDMKDMIEVTNALNYCNGYNTNAGDAINEYYKQVSKPFNRMSQRQYDERKEKVKDGKIKEILFVLSDGQFHDDPTKTIQRLREMGIIVCGIGITNEGRYILNYFGQKSNNEEKNKQGFGIVCEDASDLGNTLNELLVQHLEDPSIVG